MMFRQGAQYKSRIVAASLIGLILNQVERTNTHNLCVIFHVVLTCKLDIVLVRFLEI